MHARIDLKRSHEEMHALIRFPLFPSVYSNPFVQLSFIFVGLISIMGTKSSRSLSSQLPSSSSLPLLPLPVLPTPHPFGHEHVTISTFQAIQQSIISSSSPSSRALPDVIIQLIAEYAVHIRMVIVANLQIWSCDIHSLLTPIDNHGADGDNYGSVASSSSLSSSRSGSIWISNGGYSEQIKPRLVTSWNNELILWPDHTVQGTHHLPFVCLAYPAMDWRHSLSLEDTSWKHHTWRISFDTYPKSTTSDYTVSNPTMVAVPSLEAVTAVGSVKGKTAAKHSNCIVNNDSRREYDRVTHLFGGYNNADETLSRHAIFDGTRLRYAPNIDLPNSNPREDMLVAVDHKRTCIWLTGGFDNLNGIETIEFHQLWCYNYLTHKWTVLADVPPPFRRFSARMVVINDDLLIMVRFRPNQSSFSLTHECVTETGWNISGYITSIAVDYRVFHS
jgi:hypothetical protein